MPLEMKCSMPPAPARHRTSPLRRDPGMQAGLIAGLRNHCQFDVAAWKDLLAECGLSPADLVDGDAPVPLSKGLRVFEAAARLRRNPMLGLDYVRATDVGATGALGFAVATARTVREALQTTARFMPLVATVDISRYEETATAGTIAWRYPVADPKLSAQFAMWGTTSVIDRLQRVLSTAWRPARVEFNFPRPNEDAPYEIVFGPGLRFGKNVNKFSVDARLLDAESPTADGRLFNLMVKLATIERQRRGIADTEFEAEARAQLTALLHEGRTHLADLAEAMNLTVPQLRSDFGRHGLSFKRVIDEVRKETALNRLLESELSITEIAFSLGYTDCSVFTRACHKWFQKSPREVRQSAV